MSASATLQADVPGVGTLSEVVHAESSGIAYSCLRQQRLRIVGCHKDERGTAGERVERTQDRSVADAVRDVPGVKDRRVIVDSSAGATGVRVDLGQGFAVFVHR